MNFLCLIGLHKWDKANTYATDEHIGWRVLFHKSCLRCGKLSDVEWIRKDDKDVLR